MESVTFITTEEADDLMLSFVTQDLEGEVKSLILMRTPKYEFVFEDHERGVTVSHEDFPEFDDDLLRRIELRSDLVTIETDRSRYELDVSHVSSEEIEQARTILRRMNFDNRFTLEIA